MTLPLYACALARRRSRWLQEGNHALSPDVLASRRVEHLAVRQNTVIIIKDIYQVEERYKALREVLLKHKISFHGCIHRMPVYVSLITPAVAEVDALQRCSILSLEVLRDSEVISTKRVLAPFTPP
ncbi:hypothetical protein K443DRAFT_16147 [Laccaria amethystina LaAM-08-1]|uniref:Uncharacterized protein n=1 Tax=Laccaria amethystina LaAM-08-1 TaxID=1095629 RepID=A0A0C9WPG4_9AGAR|nr:hypothetical protein K443DRAFT_16147 [Laccaria amethystina LaAM-08-1]